MIKDSSWILAFIEDLRDVAAERSLAELSADLDAILERHRPKLARASVPQETKPGKVVPISGRKRA